MRSREPVETKRILVACKDLACASALAGTLEVAGYEHERVHDAKGVLRIVTRKPFHVIVLDLDLSQEGDIDLITFALRQRPGTQMVLLCDIAKIERAIDGIRKGAYFYLPKTVQPSDVLLVVRKALRAAATETSLNEYEQNLFEETAGATPAMRRVVELITKVAPTDSTVLLLGESGTGKEILAHAVHRLSPRRDKPFVAINCAALPETLLESEMFGHVKGAFTGADGTKRGLFEEADTGSIFLDEIGDMSLVTQAKLLRVLQNGEIRPVGASTSKHVDVRVIAATNQDLVEAVQSRTFREDLYFRLNVIQIRIPPLRERLDALPTLVNRFLTRFNAKFKKNVRAVDEHAQGLLRNYAYPGNIRELESIIAHAVILCDGDTLGVRDLPESVRLGTKSRLALPNYAMDTIPTLSEMEEQAIRATLDRFNGNQTEAAKRLGISRSTLWRKMKEFNLGGRQ
jgi:two-component system response regulator HydG